MGRREIEESMNGGRMVHEVKVKRNNMDYDGRFIIQKTVDLSLLKEGITIICVGTCNAARVG